MIELQATAKRLLGPIDWQSQVSAFLRNPGERSRTRLNAKKDCRVNVDVVRCEYAWLLATQTCDVPTDRAWLESAGKLDFDPATRLRAGAAVLLAEGKTAEAAAKAQEGLQALEHRSLSHVKSPFALDALERLLQRAGSCDRFSQNRALVWRSALNRFMLLPGPWKLLQMAAVYSNSRFSLGFPVRRIP
jgi:hypothetical protein